MNTMLLVAPVLLMVQQSADKEARQRAKPSTTPCFTMSDVAAVVPLGRRAIDRFF